MRKILLFFFLFSSFAFGAETVYTWGYGDLIAETLKVTKLIFSTNDFQDVWKLALLISLTVITVSMMTPQTDYLKLPKVIFISTGIWTIFSVNTIDVYVDDKINPNYSEAITGVPWAVGYPFALFTTSEYQMGNMYETATSLPSTLNYSNAGLFAPLSIFTAQNNHKIVDPILSANIDTYIQECVMQDLENGYKDFYTFISTDDIWAYMNNTNPASIAMYRNDDSTTQLLDCQTFYNTVNTKFLNYASVAGVGMDFLGKTIGISAPATVSSLLGASNQYLIGTSKTSQQVLMQNAALNQFNQSYKAYASVNGMDISSQSMYYATAESQSQAQMLISGFLGAKYLPAMKGILTAVILGLTPILALIMITPMGMKAFLGYIISLFWLSCWHFGDVILNHIILVKSQSVISGLGDITMQNRGIVDSSVIDYINMASQMYWTIPTIAFVVATGFSISAILGLNSSMAQSLDRQSSSVGSQAGSGNLNFGSVGHNNYNANSFSGARSVKNGSDFNFTDSLSVRQGNTSNIGDRNEFGNTTTNHGSNSFKGLQDAQTSYGNGMNNLNNLMSGMSSISTSSSNFSDSKQLSDGTIMASGTATSKDGSQVSFKDAIFMKNNDGSMSMISSGASGTEFTTANGATGSLYVKGGELTSASINESGKNGNTVSYWVDKDGKEGFVWKSGTDNSFVGGYIGKDGKYEVTQGNIEGMAIDKSQSKAVTYSESTTRGAIDSLNSSLNNEISQMKEGSKAWAYKEQFNRGVDGTIGINSKDQMIGWLASKGTGVSAGIQGSTGLEYSNDGSLSYTDKNGQTQKVVLSGEAREMYERKMSEQATNEERLSLQRDQLSQRIENALNSSNMDVNSTMTSIISDKDSFGAGSIPQDVKSNVSSSINNDVKDKISKNEQLQSKPDVTNIEEAKKVLSVDKNNDEVGGYATKSAMVVTGTQAVVDMVKEHALNPAIENVPQTIDKAKEVFHPDYKLVDTAEFNHDGSFDRSRANADKNLHEAPREAMLSAMRPEFEQRTPQSNGGIINQNQMQDLISGIETQKLNETFKVMGVGDKPQIMQQVEQVKEDKGSIGSPFDRKSK